MKRYQEILVAIVAEANGMMASGLRNNSAQVNSGLSTVLRDLKEVQAASDTHLRIERELKK